VCGLEEAVILRFSRLLRRWQGLKPIDLIWLIGTAEAVPFHKAPFSEVSASCEAVPLTGLSSTAFHGPVSAENVLVKLL